MPGWVSVVGKGSGTRASCRRVPCERWSEACEEEVMGEGADSRVWWVQPRVWPEGHFRPFRGGKCWGSAHLNPLSYPAGAEWNIPLCHVRSHPQLLFLAETLETSLPYIADTTNISCKRCAKQAVCPHSSGGVMLPGTCREPVPQKAVGTCLLGRLCWKHTLCRVPC